MANTSRGHIAGHRNAEAFREITPLPPADASDRCVTVAPGWVGACWTAADFLNDFVPPAVVWTAPALL